MSRDEFAEKMMQMAKECENYLTCMSLDVSREGKAVTLVLDTGGSGYYMEWIKGEGGDIGLFRDHETNKVVGVRLPLYNERLCVHYDGPIRINAGFGKTDSE